MAGTTLDPTQQCTMEQRIEGNRIADLQWGTTNAKQIVLAFKWHQSVGNARTVAVAIRNGALNRSYVTSFPTQTLNTILPVTLVIPGDTTGTWATDTTTGMSIAFSLATGSSFVAPSLNTWVAGNYLGFPGITTAGMSTALGFSEIGLYADPNLTGKAPPFERPSDRQTMFDSQRYWQKCMGSGGLAYSVAASLLVRGTYRVQAPMRIVPASTLVGTGRAWDQALAPNITAIQANYCTAVSNEWTFSAASGLTTYRAGVYLDGSPSIYIAQNARM